MTVQAPSRGTRSIGGPAGADAGPLVTFEEPLAVGWRATDVLDEDRQRRQRRIVVFLARLSLAVVVGGVAPIAAEDPWPFVLAVALVYVPMSSLCASDRLPGIPLPIRTTVCVAGDLVVLGSFAVLADAPESLGVGGLAMVALHTWNRGRSVGAAATVGLLATQVVTSAIADAPTSAVSIVTTALAAVLLVFVVADQTLTGMRATTGLRLVHDKAEAILSGIADAVVTTSADGTVETINRAASNLIGCDPAAAREQRCSDLLDLRDGATSLSCAGGCELLARGPGAAVELQRTGPAGQRQPLLASATPLLDADGHVVEVVHSLRDITSVKQADEAKTLFLATASHELKTPLTVIRGFAQMLRSTTLDEQRHRDATTAIEARAVQLSAIVDRLLMTSRIEAGRVELHPSLARVDETFVQRARELEAATSRQVDRSVPDDLPEAWVDLDAVATVVDHLLENAVKYSPNGGPITLDASATEDEIVLRIADEGVGMTAEQLERCFDRFWQAEGTDVRRFGGTGIGLYIVRSLVEAMGGTVEAEAAPGEGSTFTVTLRRRPPAAPAAPDPVATLHEGSGDGSTINEFMRQVGMPVEARGAAR